MIVLMIVLMNAMVVAILMESERPGAMVQSPQPRAPTMSASWLYVGRFVMLVGLLVGSYVGRFVCLLE